jgi:hypothetical protein
MSTWYIEVMEFLKKVFWGDIELQIYLYIKWYEHHLDWLLIV